MVRSVFSGIVVFLLASLIFLMSGPAAAQEESSGTLEVAEAAICRKVVALECIDPGSEFKEGVENLYCFSRIKGAEGTTSVTHVWYYGDVELARVELPVRSDNWRTYSSKRIGPTQTGPWHVEIQGPSGKTLKVVALEIVP